MTGHCPKCKTRWTAFVENVVIDGRPAKIFKCPKAGCRYTSTQRVRTSKKIVGFGDLHEDEVFAVVTHTNFIWRKEGNRAIAIAEHVDGIWKIVVEVIPAIDWKDYTAVIRVKLNFTDENNKLLRD